MESSLYTPYQSLFWATSLTLRGGGDDLSRLSQSIASARVDLNPHQVDAALAALRSPLSKGMILADEVGLGKTIEDQVSSARVREPPSFMGNSNCMLGGLFLILTSANLALGGNVQNLPALPNGTIANSVQVDASGNIFVAGYLTPQTPKSSNDISDAFAAKLSSDGSQITWLAVLSGSADDRALAIALGVDDSVYITGVTTSTDFPTTGKSMQPAQGYQGAQAFAAKLNPNGSVSYASYIGGPTQAQGNGIAVDASGNAYVTGATSGLAGFPTTVGAVIGDTSQSTGFILKLDPIGAKALVAIRGFGGKKIAVDAQENIYAAGAFASAPGTVTGPLAPTTTGAVQTRPANEVCSASMIMVASCQYQHIAKIDPTGTLLIYATYISGTYGATPQGMAVDSSGNVIVAGYTNSFDYPTTPRAYQPEYFGEAVTTFLPPAFSTPPMASGYVSKLNASGTGLIWSTYFGGSGIVNPGQEPAGDDVYGMAIDPIGNILLAGIATSKDLPGLWATPVVSRPPSQGAGFVGRLTPDGIILSATQLFSTNPNLSTGIAARADGTAVVVPALVSASFSSIGRVAAITDSADNAKLVAVAPGQLLTLYGTALAPADPAQPSSGLPTAFNGVSVTFNGIAAPILYTSGIQVNLQVPYEIAGQGQVTMLVSSQFVSSPVAESYTLAVVDHQASVFLSPAGFQQPFLDITTCNGQQVAGLQPLALNADGTLNSCANPAVSGSIVTIFLNGIGITSPAPATGTISSLATTITPGVALLGSNPSANILSTDTLPGSIASLAQVQIQVSSTSLFLNILLEVGSGSAFPVRGPGVVIWTKPSTISAAKLTDESARRR